MLDFSSLPNDLRLICQLTERGAEEIDMKMSKLRQLRRDGGLTQYGLAKATGIDRTKISHAELGVVTLTDEELKRIRKVLLDAARKKSERILKTLDSSAA